MEDYLNFSYADTLNFFEQLTFSPSRDHITERDINFAVNLYVCSLVPSSFNQNDLLVTIVFAGKIQRFRLFKKNYCILFCFPDMITLKAFKKFLSKVVPALCISAVNLERIISSKISAPAKGTSPKIFLEMFLS